MTAAAADSSRRWLWAAALITVFKLWLTRGQDVFALGYAAHDDVLFLRLADSLRHGDWLGPYDQLTLAKGPMYSFWIAALALLHVPLYFANQLLYAGACALLVRACAPAVSSAAVRFTGYLVLLWNPMSFDASSLGRVLRQHIYSPEVLLIFAGLIALHYRRDRPARQLAPWAILLGLAIAAFYLTREEAIWIVPSAGLLGGATLWLAWRESRAALRSVVRALMLAAGCMLLPLLAVSALNYRSYGWFGTVEFRATEFADAYGALTRVQVGASVPFTPITRQAREAAYAVSPAFAELRPQLEGDLGRGWAEASSSTTGRPPEEHEIGGGWMTWALRDATAAAGHAHSAGEAMAFYKQIALEVNAACDGGKLPAGPARSGFAPALRPDMAGETGRVFLQFADFTTSFSRFSAFPPPSAGDEASLVLFRQLTHEQLSDGAPSAFNLIRIRILHAIGKGLRPVLLLLVCAAQVIAAGRVVLVLARRTWTFPLTIAAAAWGGAIVYLLLTAVIQVTSYPILAISSFAPVYPLLLVFVTATLWDAGAAWQRSRGQPRRPATPRTAPAPLPAPAAVPPLTGALRHLPWIMGLLALTPFVIWQSHFAQLFWFGDDLFLVDQMSYMGLWHWTGTVFSENFVPLFKLLWGGTVMLSGSYLALLWLMWLTHACNTMIFGRLLLRAGFSWPAVLCASVLFALPAANLETLGWSVQWSALLATLFLLVALEWTQRRAGDRGDFGWRLWLPLAIFSAASACSFSRGVLTGPVVAVALLWPALVARNARALWPRLPAAVAAMLPAIAVAIAIKLESSGNHQHLAGHAGEILWFGTCYFLFNPFHTLLNPSLAPGALALVGVLKVGIIAGGLLVARGRVRQLLVVLLAYDLGSSLLLGIGRYHTGFAAAMSSRYQYSSLLATLPFVAVLLGAALDRLAAAERPRRWASFALAAVLAAYALAGWPAALAEFTGWRGTEIRALLAAPATNDPAATMPSVEFIHVERAKALVRAYDLH